MRGSETSQRGRFLTGDFRAPYGSATAGWWLAREKPRDGSLAWDPSSSGNFASNSASEIPNALAVALFGAPNAIIARTKRRSASPNFEAPHFSAASASLSACTRGVIAFGFRPEPGLAPPRPIPLDFVIFKPKMMQKGNCIPLGVGLPSTGSRPPRKLYAGDARIRAAASLAFLRQEAPKRSLPGESPAGLSTPGRGVREIQLNGPSGGTMKPGAATLLGIAFAIIGRSERRPRPSSHRPDDAVAHLAGGSITLQFVRPDIRQSCILLVAVSSCANHNPTTSRTAAMANPAIAGRRLPPRSGSSIAKP
jgi:hypothetical protein